jgi:hypothetical protein
LSAFGVMGLLSCSQNPNALISGNWRVVSITSDAPLPEYKLDEFQFSFTEEGQYSYTGNLYYREAGNYYIQSSYLYTADTLNETSAEKVVQIIKLTKDSLFLRMADETLMKLVPQ